MVTSVISSKPGTATSINVVVRAGKIFFTNSISSSTVETTSQYKPIPVKKELTSDKDSAERTSEGTLEPTTAKDPVATVTELMFASAIALASESDSTKVNPVYYTYGYGRTSRAPRQAESTSTRNICMDHKTNSLRRD